MAIRESVINPPTRGAGRTLDWSYPGTDLETIGTNNQGGVEWVNRQGFVQVAMGVNFAFGVPPAGSQWQMYRGRICFRQTGNGTSGGGYTTDNSFAITFAQNQLVAAYNEDFACWRLVAILAFDAGLGSGDTGLEVGAGIGNGGYNVIASLNPGFRIGPSSATAAVFQVRQNGGLGLTINTTLINTLDTTDWNAYELRFIGATNKRDAIVKAFINGQQLSQASWGAGTLLPGWGNGATIGYSVGVGNRGANGTYICMNGLQIQAAATEDALL